VPVRIIISLLWALISVSVSSIVLSSVYGLTSNVSLLSSVGNEESHVSLSSRAGLIVGPWLVHSIEEISSSIGGNGTVIIVRDGIGGSSVSHSGLGVFVSVGAHVLHDHVAVKLWILATTVLVGPFYGQ